MDYLKKARGTITATCRCSPPSSPEESRHEVTADLVDGGGEVVARATAQWLVRPRS
jgi:acyl-coenzyme A thioesterase PaaI-like protein